MLKKRGKNSGIRILLLVFLTVSLLFSFGCTKTEKTEPSGEIVDSLQNTSQEAINESNKIMSPLTGLMVDKLNDRVIAVMFDNQSKARPQAGLSQCDIVYEILAEGNITRYLGVIGSEQPSNIGSIRSSRDYFIQRALEYNSLYVHVGGSPQAYEAIEDYHVASVNGMNQSSKIFWRKSHKKAPHNMYSSYDAILTGAQIKKYDTVGTYDHLDFYESDQVISGEDLFAVEFPYSKDYVSSFRYNSDEKLYYRYINRKPHLDENDNVPITAKNIIVQFAKTKIISGDTAGRLDIDMIGEGDGYYITDGKYMKIIWRKNDIYSLTRYYDVYGSEITLNPGKIWIQVYPDYRSDKVIIQSTQDSIKTTQ